MIAAQCGGKERFCFDNEESIIVKQIRAMMIGAEECGRFGSFILFFSFFVSFISLFYIFLYLILGIFASALFHFCEKFSERVALLFLFALYIVFGETYLRVCFVYHRKIRYNVCEDNNECQKIYVENSFTYNGRQKGERQCRREKIYISKRYRTFCKYSKRKR